MESKNASRNAEEQYPIHDAGDFVLPNPGELRKQSNINKSSSEARFNHSGVSYTQANSSMFNRSGFAAEDFKRNYGDKLYDRQSASTLLHSINSFSIPKSVRFPDSRRDNYSNGGSTLPSTLSSKGPDFSKPSGRKPLIKVNNGQDPGPGTYPLKSEFGQVSYNEDGSKVVIGLDGSKGKSFGIGYAAYRNAFSMGMDPNVQADSEMKAKPGPGAYELPKSFGSSGKFITLGSRHREGAKLGGIGPIYNPNYRPVEQARYDTQSMGIGGRHDFTKQSTGVPGPVYTLPSAFDKYKNSRLDSFKDRARQKSQELLKNREARLGSPHAATEGVPVGGILSSYK